MYCNACGNQLSTDQRFCMKCGRAVGLVNSAAPQNRVRQNIYTLGILWIIYSVFRLVMLVPATVFFGRFARLPFFADMPMGMHGMLGSLLGLFVVLTVIKSTAGIILGVGLLHHAPWARPLALVLAVFALIHPLLGTAIGVYTLWVLLPQNSGQEYETLTREATA
jgi:hypothetical protein